MSDKSAVLVCLLEVYPLMHYVQDVVVLMHFSFPESVTCLFPILSRQLQNLNVTLRLLFCI